MSISSICSINSFSSIINKKKFEQLKKEKNLEKLRKQIELLTGDLEECKNEIARLAKEKAEIEKEEGLKDMAPSRPYDASGQSKKRHSARQTFGNIKKVFRRKSI